MLELEERPHHVFFRHVGRQPGQVADRLDHLRGGGLAVAQRPDRHRGCIQQMDLVGGRVVDRVLGLGLAQPDVGLPRREAGTHRRRH